MRPGDSWQRLLWSLKHGVLLQYSFDEVVDEAVVELGNPMLTIADGIAVVVCVVNTCPEG